MEALSTVCAMQIGEKKSACLVVGLESFRSSKLGLKPKHYTLVGKSDKTMCRYLLGEGHGSRVVPVRRQMLVPAKTVPHLGRHTKKMTETRRGRNSYTPLGNICYHTTPSSQRRVLRGVVSSGQDRK